MRKRGNFWSPGSIGIGLKDSSSRVELVGAPPASPRSLYDQTFSACRFVGNGTGQLNLRPVWLHSDISPHRPGLTSLQTERGQDSALGQERDLHRP